MKHSLGVILAMGTAVVSSGLKADDTAWVNDAAVLSQEEAVSEGELAFQRAEGINFLNINEAELNGTNNNNTAINTVSGGNFIGDYALIGNHGLTNVIQNSGNNVLIQESTIVTINIMD